MPVETPILSLAGGPAEGPAPPRANDPFVGALQEFFRALHKTAMYPPGHPSIQGAIARACEQITMALEGRLSVRVGVARDHVLLDRSPITDGPAVLEALAHFLHGLDIGVVELHAGLTADELGRFLFRLREARREKWKGATLVNVLAGDRLDHIGVVRLDYNNLSFSAHADANREAAGPTEVWDGIVLNLSDLGTTGIGIEPESLAQEANLRFVNDDGVGGGLLRKELCTLGTQMRGMEQGQREALRSRLGRFVQALNPELRQDLLRMDPKDPEASMTVVAELSDGLPDTTLLDILRDLNRTGQRAHDQFLGFLNKMARLPAGDGAVLPDLVSAMDRWGVSGLIEEDPRTFRAALSAVLTRRQIVDCNPEAYQQHLDGLTRRELPAATRLLCERYRDPSDPDDVQAQVFELAVLLLSDGQGKEHAPGIIGHVGASTDRLLDTGRFHPVREAANAIRVLTGSESEPPEVRRAASGFLRDFSSKARIDRILDHALEGGQIHGAAEPLLALGGAKALERILERLDSSTDPALSGVLRGVAVRMGSAPLVEVIEHRWSRGWAGLEPVFSILRLLPTQESMPVLESLAAHPEARVRREVLAFHCELDRGNAERYLRQALSDPDPGFVNLVIQRLASRGTRESLETLGAFVEGDATQQIPALPQLRRAAEGLTDRGDLGVHRLCGCLHRLRRTLKPSRASAGATVRQVLEPYRADPLVARAVSKWRVSPAAVVARLIPAAAFSSERE